MIQYLNFFFGTQKRAKISLVILGVLMIVIVFAPWIISQILGNLIGGILGGIAPFLGVILLFALLWGAIKKIGGLGK
ncbi:MAG: hypothetical protein WCP24_01050 [bacterium]